MVDEPRRRPALAEAARLFRTQVVAIGGPLQLQAVSTGGWFAESTAWSPPSQTAASSTRRCTLPTPTRQGRSSPAGRLPTALTSLGFTPAPNLHPDQVPRLVQARVGLGPARRRSAGREGGEHSLEFGERHGVGGRHGVAAVGDAVGEAVRDGRGRHLRRQGREPGRVECVLQAVQFGAFHPSRVALALLAVAGVRAVLPDDHDIAHTGEPARDRELDERGGGVRGRGARRRGSGGRTPGRTTASLGRSAAAGGECARQQCRPGPGQACLHQSPVVRRLPGCGRPTAPRVPPGVPLW
ncbi:hypothetical protein JE024_37770 [Streptomyces zhihengii]|uniref:Uncharacterized protein n=1 Tax=Streptomyces zhihengii TaxID=1818004 RepID=A0ABS2V385_9ACTN|nr:hypothetical protein [Streptomyces zhihengii]